MLRSSFVATIKLVKPKNKIIFVFIKWQLVTELKENRAIWVQNFSTEFGVL